MSKTGKDSYSIMEIDINKVVIKVSGYHKNLCGCNRNNASIIWAAIIALILVNCLDDECLDNLAAFFQMLGDALALGITKSCFNSCQRQDIKNCYY